ncbi:hypothetical protein Vretimale_4447, partial [Volvox reticuliferus]
STAAPDKISDSWVQAAQLPVSEETLARAAGLTGGACVRSIIPHRHDARNLWIYEDDCEDDPALKGLDVRKDGGSPQTEAMGNGQLSAGRPGTSMVLQDRKPFVNGAVTTTGTFLWPTIDGLKHTSDARKPQLHAQVTGEKRQSIASKENIMDQADLAAGPISLGANDAIIVANGRTRRSSTQRIR